MTINFLIKPFFCHFCFYVKKLPRYLINVYMCLDTYLFGLYPHNLKR